MNTLANSMPTLREIPPDLRGIPLAAWMLKFGHQVSRDDLDAWARRVEREKLDDAKKYGRKVKV